MKEVAIDEAEVGKEELWLLSSTQEGRLFRPQFEL